MRAEPTPTKTGQHTREARITHQHRAETPVQVRTDLRSASGRRERSGGRARPRGVALGARRRSGWEAGRRSHASPAEEVTEGEQRSESGRGREEAPREAGGKRTKITASKVRLQLWGGVGTRRGCRTEGGRGRSSEAEEPWWPGAGGSVVSSGSIRLEVVFSLASSCEKKNYISK